MALSRTLGLARDWHWAALVRLALALGKGTRALLVLALAVIAAAGLKAAASLVVPLLVAAFIAAATQPLVDWLESRGLPTAAAVLATMFGAALCVVGFGALVALAIGDLGDSLPGYERSIARTKLQVVGWLSAHGLARAATSVARFDVAENLETAAARLALEVPEALTAAGIILFVMIFLLLEVASFRRKMRHALHWVPAQFDHVRRAVDDVKMYLLVKTAVSAATGVLCGISCVLFGLEAALLWGLIAFVLNFIPNIGSAIAAVPPVGLALIQFGPGRALGILCAYVVINNLIGNLLEPKIMGRALGISPLVVVLSVIIWGWLLGPVGALLSVPLTMTVKLICAHTEDLKWIAVLLGSGDGHEEAEYIVERERTTGTSLNPAPVRARSSTV